MTKVLVDTNVVLSFVTDRNHHQQRLAADLFEKAVAGTVELVLHQIALTELVYVLRNLYGRTDSDVAALLRDLLSLPGVTPVDVLAWPRLLDLWPGKIKDFADAALVAVAIEARVDFVATFDRDLRRRLPRFKLTPRWSS